MNTTSASSSSAATTLTTPHQHTETEKIEIPAEEQDNHYLLSVNDTLAALAASHNGLTSNDAANRLANHGHNVLNAQKPTTALAILWHQIYNIMTFILIAVVTCSFALQSYVEAVCVLLLILFNTVVGFFQERNAEEMMASLKKLSSPTSKVIRDNGTTMVVDTADLVAGDLVIVETGNIIPADMRIVEASNLEVDEALLTGETVPVKKSINLDKVEERSFVPLGDRKNMLFGSTIVTKGRGRAIVTSTGMRTEIGKIATMLSSTKVESKAIIEQSLNKLAYALFVASALSFLIVFAANQFRFSRTIILYALSAAITTIPTSLTAVMTVTIACGMNRMAKQKALVRKMNVIDSLACVTDICTDKTGTLTAAKMTLTRFFLAHTRSMYDVSGIGFAPVGNVSIANKTENDGGEHFAPDMERDELYRRFLLVSSLCNSSEVVQDEESGDWVAHGDFTEAALAVFARKVGMSKSELIGSSKFEQLAENPFDSFVKRMSTIHLDKSKTDKGTILVLVKGAWERISELCCVEDENLNRNPLSNDPSLVNSLSEMAEVMAGDGLRVLAVAYKEIAVERIGEVQNWSREEAECDLTFLGFAGINDPPRPETRGAVESSRAAGIKVRMLTGDHLATAAAIARQINILQPSGSNSSGDDDLIMTATEFDNLSDEKVDNLSELPVVVARCSPNTKVKMIRALGRRNKVVAMTGDGVNDSPALKIAAVGFAMGLQGSDVAKEASDIILTDDNFATVVDTIAEGRRVFDNIQRFTFFLLSGNLSMWPLLLGALAFVDSSGEPIQPLSAVQVLFLTFVLLSIPGIALGMEPATRNIMSRPPRPADVGLFDREFLVDTVLFGCILALFSFLPIWLTAEAVLYGPPITGTDCNETLNAGCESAFRLRGLVGVYSVTIFAVHLYNCREPRLPTFDRKALGLLRKNKLMWISAAFSISLNVLSLYIPYVNDVVFRQIPILWQDWILVVLLTVGFWIASEGYKFVKRRYLVRWLHLDF